MPVSRPSSDGPTTAAEFQANLAWLLRNARDNDVDVTGGWVHRSDGHDYPDWGIEVYRVTKRSRQGE